MGGPEIEAFLTHLGGKRVVKRKVWASTRNQALNAIVFLYKQILAIDRGAFNVIRAKRDKRLPVVLSSAEDGAIVTIHVPMTFRARGGQREIILPPA